MKEEFIYNKIDWKVPIERSLLINKKIDNSSMRLYLILLSYARDKTQAFPSRETLALDMGCSVRNIDLLKIKLKNNNLLDWKTKSINNKKHNTYFLLQYSPIKSDMKQKIAPTKSKKLLVNNKHLSIKKTTAAQQFKNSSLPENNFNNIINIWKESYKDICNNINPEIKDNVNSGWINNSNYYITNGDKRNLEQYYSENGDAGIKKLEISFNFLKDYLEDKIEYGQFYNTNGAELIPTISLFAKSKIQHDGIIEFATHKLRVANKEFG